MKTEFEDFVRAVLAAAVEATRDKPVADKNDGCVLKGNKNDGLATQTPAPGVH